VSLLGPQLIFADANGIGCMGRVELDCSHHRYLDRLSPHTLDAPSCIRRGFCSFQVLSGCDEHFDYPVLLAARCASMLETGRRVDRLVVFPLLAHATPPMTLGAAEFLRRFCLHVPPKGFMRDRPFGILANCHRRKKLAHARKLLDASATPNSAAPMSQPPEDPSRCPHCEQAALHCVLAMRRPRVDQRVARTYQPQPFDSS